METVKIVNVTLTQETCEVCESSLAESIVQRRVCHRFIDRKCPDGKWIRRCQSEFDEDEDKSREPRDHQELVRYETQYCHVLCI